MGEEKESYVLFAAGQFYFLLPLFCVKKVSDVEQIDEGTEIADFGADTGRYAIVLEKESRTLGLRADGISGVLEISDDELLKLKEPVINSGNAYLKAAVPVQNDLEEEVLAYVLGTDELMAWACREPVKRV